MDSKKRAIRTRFKLKSNADSSRIRLSVFKSLKHLYVQAIDDSLGVTVASFGSDAKEVKANKYKGVQLAEIVGKKIAEKLVALDKKRVFFDRGRYSYHGKIKILAESARANGLEF